MPTKQPAPAKAIVIQCGDHGSIRIELNAAKTAETIYQALPLSAEAETWGEEVYFSLPLSIAQEKGTRDVAVGDVGWWPPGNAIAIFFGRTPASSGPKPVPASAVTLIGRVATGVDVLRKVEAGDKLGLRKG